MYLDQPNDYLEPGHRFNQRPVFYFSNEVIRRRDLIQTILGV
jgi:hypothetical protein